MQLELMTCARDRQYGRSCSKITLLKQSEFRRSLVTVPNEARRYLGNGQEVYGEADGNYVNPNTEDFFMAITSRPASIALPLDIDLTFVPNLTHDAFDSLPSCCPQACAPDRGRKKLLGGRLFGGSS